MSHNGIGVRNERSLHAALKQWYARPEDEFEVSVDGFIVDIVRGDLLVEVQTRNLASQKRKLSSLLERHYVHVIFPIAHQKWIVKTTAKGRIKSKRKSPKRGKLIDLFNELVSVPELINHPNFTLEIVLTDEVEIRRADGRGSWRRRGVSIHDRRLEGVVESVCFEHNTDFARFLPEGMEQPFTNRELAAQMRIPLYVAQKITYCLKKMGVIRETGKTGRALLFEKVGRDVDNRTGISE